MVNLNVSLAYRDDKKGEWTEMAHSKEQRKLDCIFTAPKVNTHTRTHTSIWTRPAFTPAFSVCVF